MQSDELQGVPDWLQEFKHGLINESVPEHRDTSRSSHELPVEPHIIFMSPAIVPYMEKVYSIVRQIYGRSPTDDLNDLDENNAMWEKFMNVTLQAAVHLSRDFLENLRLTKNQLLKSVKQLFQVTEKLKKDQTDICGLTTIDYDQPTWRSTTKPTSSPTWCSVWEI